MSAPHHLTHTDDTPTTSRDGGQRKGVDDFSRRLAALCALLLLCIGCAKASRSVNKTTRSGNYLKAQVRLMLVSTMPADQQQASQEVKLLREYIQFERIQQTRQLQQLKRQPDRKKQCKTICQASGGICESTKRICQISQQYPKETAFKRACAAATKDCKDSQNTCKSC